MFNRNSLSSFICSFSPLWICVSVRVVSLDFPNLPCMFPPPGLYLAQSPHTDSASFSIPPSYSVYFQSSPPPCTFPESSQPKVSSLYLRLGRQLPPVPLSPLVIDYTLLFGFFSETLWSFSYLTIIFLFSVSYSPITSHIYCTITSHIYLYPFQYQIHIRYLVDACQRNEWMKIPTCGSGVVALSFLIGAGSKTVHTSKGRESLDLRGCCPSDVSSCLEDAGCQGAVECQ